MFLGWDAGRREAAPAEAAQGGLEGTRKRVGLFRGHRHWRSILVSGSARVHGICHPRHMQHHRQPPRPRQQRRGIRSHDLLLGAGDAGGGARPGTVQDQRLGHPVKVAPLHPQAALTFSCTLPQRGVSRTSVLMLNVGFKLQRTLSTG